MKGKRLIIINKVDDFDIKNTIYRITYRRICSTRVGFTKPVVKILEINKDFEFLIQREGKSSKKLVVTKKISQMN